MNEQQLKQVFRQIGQSQIPDTADIWPAVYERVSLQTQKRSGQRRIAHLRLRGALLTVVAVLLLTSAAYALGPLLQEMLNRDPALTPIMQNEGGQIINQTQTQQDVAVTLEWAYADENRASIFYTISPNREDRYELVENQLFTADGTLIPSFVGMVDMDQSTPTDGYLFSYDLSSYQPQTTKLDLHLSLLFKSAETDELLAPFEFQFSVQMDVARFAHPNQTVVFNDIPVTLQNVTVSRTEVTSLICFDNPNPEFNGWLPISQIDVHSENQTVQAVVGQQSILENGCVMNRYFPSLYEAQGSWTLTVTELVGFKPGKPFDENTPSVFSCPEGEERSEYCGEQLRIAGSWAFSFDLEE